MIFFFWITIGYLLSSPVTASSKEGEGHTEETEATISESRPLIPTNGSDANTRIDIENNRDYDTGETSKQNVFKCEDITQMVMSQ